MVSGVGGGASSGGRTEEMVVVVGVGIDRRDEDMTGRRACHDGGIGGAGETDSTWVGPEQGQCVPHNSNVSSTGNASRRLATAW